MIAASLHPVFGELDRTAVRPWWPWRLAHLLGLTAVAAALLSTAVLGDARSYGPPTMIRNTLGCTGVTAASAVLLGARLSRLPAFGYGGAVYLASGGARDRAVTVWAWPMQQAAWAAPGRLRGGRCPPRGVRITPERAPRLDRRHLRDALP
ncbi:hypothetical protein [Streptomyces sp. NPDC127105]|uniref:hypothetical protein n=1 Tax=Streptomyces sp. NPDC127105 TaxID=3345359 RepID=UPI00364C6F91